MAQVTVLWASHWFIYSTDLGKIDSGMKQVIVFMSHLNNSLNLLIKNAVENFKNFINQLFGSFLQYCV